MPPPAAILIETRVLDRLPQWPHVSLVVEVWRRDGWYAYRAYADDWGLSNRPQFEVTSETVWFAKADGAARAGEAHLHEHLQRHKQP